MGCSIKKMSQLRHIKLHPFESHGGGTQLGYALTLCPKRGIQHVSIHIQAAANVHCACSFNKWHTTTIYRNQNSPDLLPHRLLLRMNDQLEFAGQSAAWKIATGGPNPNWEHNKFDSRFENEMPMIRQREAQWGNKYTHNGAQQQQRQQDDSFVNLIQSAAWKIANGIIQTLTPQMEQIEP